MNLQKQGFRFIRRGSRYDWMHPTDIQPGDEDCTDMSDDEFDANVATHGYIRPETTYEKSARWAWPDGRPEL
jgi:hypothetical protein